MNRNLAIGIAAAFALTATTIAFAGSIESGDRLEMAAVLKAPVTPTQAVHIATSDGDRAYGYGMEATSHDYWYEVDVLRGDAKLELLIDATTGKVLGSAPARGEDTQGAHALDGSTLAFNAAIAEADRVGHGPALEASAAGQGSSAHVDVDVIQDHGKRIAHYRVSMHDGKFRTVLTGSDA